MRKLILAAALLIGGATMPAANVMACSCMPPGTPQEALEKSTRVFLGTVTSVDVYPTPANTSAWGRIVSKLRAIFDPPEAEEHERFPHRRVRLAVTENFKGSPVDRIRLTTSMDSASCGVAFEKGQQYVVFANGREGALTASLCSRTRLASSPDSGLPQLRKIGN